MDEPDAGAKPGDLEPRPPREGDLVGLCRQLNQREARYIVIGGFAGRMKVNTHREKDAGDLVFLRYWFSEHGQEPPK